MDANLSDTLHCCFCFQNLEIEFCNWTPDGDREDVCQDCGRLERIAMALISAKPSFKGNPWLIQ